MVGSGLVVLFYLPALIVPKSCHCSHTIGLFKILGQMERETVTEKRLPRTQMSSSEDFTEHCRVLKH